jgi:hypothetical protein
MALESSDHGSAPRAVKFGNAERAADARQHD